MLFQTHGPWRKIPTQHLAESRATQNETLAALVAARNLILNAPYESTGLIEAFESLDAELAKVITQLEQEQFCYTVAELAAWNEGRAIA